MAVWIKVVTASSGVLAELENKARMSNLVQGSFSMKWSRAGPVPGRLSHPCLPQPGQGDGVGG